MHKNTGTQGNQNDSWQIRKIIIHKDNIAVIKTNL